MQTPPGGERPRRDRPSSAAVLRFVRRVGARETAVAARAREWVEGMDLSQREPETQQSNGCPHEPLLGLLEASMLAQPLLLLLRLLPGGPPAIIAHSITQQEQRIDVLALPMHSRSLEPRLDHEFVGALHHARAHGPARGPVGGHCIWDLRLTKYCSFLPASGVGHRGQRRARWRRTRSGLACLSRCKTASSHDGGRRRPASRSSSPMALTYSAAWAKSKTRTASARW